MRTHALLACALWYTCACGLPLVENPLFNAIHCRDFSSRDWTDYGAFGTWYIGKAWPDTFLTNSSVNIRSAHAEEVDNWKRMKGNNWTETSGLDTGKTLMMTVTPQQKDKKEVDIRTVLLTPRIALVGGYRAILASNVGTLEERAASKFDLVFFYMDSYLMFMDCVNMKVFLLSKKALRDDGTDDFSKADEFLRNQNVYSKTNTYRTIV